MDVWQLALFAVASFVAMRLLVALMAQHKQRYLEKLLLDDAYDRQARRKSAADAKPQDTKPEDAAA